MKCPFCGFGQDRVVDSRESKEADSIRRRRECERCNRRFTTYERIDEIPYMVVKKDGRRERFDRQKVLSGLLRACEKRPVSSGQLEKIVDATETYLVDAPERERSTREIGELMNVPEGTVRTRLMRARAELQERWTARRGEAISSR